MALNTELADVAANASANAIGALLNGGTINIYSGTQPATADTALAGNTLLATLNLNATFAPSASGGVLTANAITGNAAVATGTATFFRAFKSDGTTAVFDGSVGTSAANLILPTVSIQSGVTVTCSSFTFTQQKSTAGL